MGTPCFLGTYGQAAQGARPFLKTYEIRYTASPSFARSSQFTPPASIGDTLYPLNLERPLFVSIWHIQSFTIAYGLIYAMK